MRITVADVIRETAAKHRLTVAELLGPSRERKYVRPRQEAMYQVFTKCPHISYPEAGRRMGGRDHTTVLHGVKAHAKRLGIDYADAMQIRKGGINKPVFAIMASAYAKSLEAHRVQ
jgi:hypothetical protein